MKPYRETVVDVTTELAILTEIMKKQVPKLVKYRRNEKPVCPTCGWSFSDDDVEYDVSYCKFCGQRVSLEMEDDELVVVCTEERENE